MTAMICNAERPEFLEPMPLYVMKEATLCYLCNAVCGEAGLCAPCEDAEDQHGKRAMMERKKCCRGCWGPYWVADGGRVVCSCDAEPEVMAQEEEDEDEATYEDDFCMGCGIQLSACESTYCNGCVCDMDENFKEKEMKKGRGCTSCGHKFKQTAWGIRCGCDCE